MLRVHCTHAVYVVNGMDNTADCPCGIMVVFCFVLSHNSHNTKPFYMRSSIHWQLAMECELSLTLNLNRNSIDVGCIIDLWLSSMNWYVIGCTNENAKFHRGIRRCRCCGSKGHWSLSKWAAYVSDAAHTVTASILTKIKKLSVGVNRYE